MLDLAAEGRTDTQIAQILGLSQSTVNSYWVRIRGKIGQLSRTELVVGLLRHRTNLEHAALREENVRLREEIGSGSGRMDDLGPGSIDWTAKALLHVPMAVLVTEPPARVMFANQSAERLYRAQPGGLVGLPMRDLTTAATPEAFREPCRPLFEEDGPERETIGVDQAYYARRRDGSNFRAVLHAERFAGKSGLLAVLTVRGYLEDTETILRVLREPLAPCA